VCRAIGLELVHVMLKGLVDHVLMFPGSETLLLGFALQAPLCMGNLHHGRELRRRWWEKQRGLSWGRW
jgi:hypothetical protein